MNDPAAPAAAAPAAASSSSDSGPRPGVRYSVPLHLYAILLGVCVFLLIGIGGTVTSTGAGMAVPDYPTTLGYNMFTVPLNEWLTGDARPDVFWEHFHRLMGSLVGVLTIGMVVWLTVAQRSRRWLVAAGWGLLLMVIIQGLMGGFRVTEESIRLAMLHGILGQLVLGCCVLIAAATSRPWVEAVTGPRAYAVHAEPGKVFGMRYVAGVLLLLLVVQLALGAWMRHNAAGLAVPDFPTAYGQVLPPLHQQGLAQTQAAWEVAHDQPLTRPYSVAQVSVHMAHRAGAAVVCAVALVLLVWVNVVAPGHRLTAWPARGLAALLALQVMLGAYVIWSRRHVDIATAHQAGGALLLALATLLTIRLNLLRYTGVGETLPHKPSPEKRSAEGPDQSTRPGRSGASPSAQPSALMSR
ncbi:MAG: COX15/CtaA family protein [Phycisphaeraceae bacterium]